MATKPLPPHVVDPYLARRRSRFTYALRRIEKIASAEPRFTREEVEELCAILRSGANGQA